MTTTGIGGELIREIVVDVVRIRITRWANEPLPYATHLVTPLGSNFYGDYDDLDEAVADAEVLVEDFRSDIEREQEEARLVARGGSRFLMDGVL